MSRKDQEIGLYRKFWIKRVDGKDLPGQKHEGCRYFVLDLDHDEFAEAAIIAYAEACKNKFPELSNDLLTRLSGHLVLRSREEAQKEQKRREIKKEVDGQ